MPTDQEKIERFYLPTVVTLDATQKNAQAFVWQAENRKRRNFAEADAMMKRPDYQGPDKDTWEMYTLLVGARNKIARLLSIQDIQGFDPELGYTLDSLESFRQNLTPIDVRKLRVATVPHQLNEKYTSVTDQQKILLPMVRAIDYVISKMERLCWDEAYPKYGQNHLTNFHLQKVSVTPPELVRDALHITRRHAARLCVLPDRPKHSWGDKPQWVLSVDGEYDFDPKDTIDESSVTIS